MQFERRIAVRGSAATQMMIRSGASALGVTEAEYVRICIHAMQTEESLQAASVDEEPPANPLRVFYVPEGKG